MGVSRIHALEHPGLRFLVLTDGSAPAKRALAAAGQLARLAQARVLLLSYSERAGAQSLQEAKELVGGGLVAFDTRASCDPLAEVIAQEVDRQPVDLVIAGADPANARMLAQSLLQCGEHHVLLVPGEQPAPRRALICVATGEPGKEDILFAGRLVRHLEAEAQLLAVLPPDGGDPALLPRAERFLRNGARTLEMLGVPAQTRVRRGAVYEEITGEMKGGGYDLLVLGAPLPARDGSLSLSGVAGQILDEVQGHPVLIVRSVASSPPRSYLPAPLSHATMIKELTE
jgi:sulfate transport system ATP-binding protein